MKKNILIVAMLISVNIKAMENEEGVMMKNKSSSFSNLINKGGIIGATGGLFTGGLIGYGLEKYTQQVNDYEEVVNRRMFRKEIENE